MLGLNNLIIGQYSVLFLATILQSLRSADSTTCKADYQPYHVLEHSLHSASYQL
jgi:hypothetical protein